MKSNTEEKTNNQGENQNFQNEIANSQYFQNHEKN